MKKYIKWIILLLILLLAPISWILIIGDFKFNWYVFTTEWYKIVFSTLGMSLVVNILLKVMAKDEIKKQENELLKQKSKLLKTQKETAEKILKNDNSFNENISRFKSLHNEIIAIGIEGTYFVSNHSIIISNIEYCLKTDISDENKKVPKESILKSCEEFCNKK